MVGSCSLNGLNRGLWTGKEDKLLADYIDVHGEGKWSNVAKKTGLKRCGKSCRLRWLNYLRPNIKRGNISDDEELLIVRLHKLLGNRWSLIAGRLPGRTDNEIKNYWNSHLSKKAQTLELILPRLPSKQGPSRSSIHLTCTNEEVSDPHETKGDAPVNAWDESSDVSWASGDNDFLLDFEVEDLRLILDTQDEGRDDMDATMNSDADHENKTGHSESSDLMPLVSFLDTGVDWQAMP